MISSHSDISIQEKILQDRQTYTQEQKVKGPSIDLFYHELNDRSPKMRRLLDLVFGSMTYILYILLNPFILAYLRLSGVSSPYREFNGVGQFGNIIKARIYNIGYYQSVDDDTFSNTTTANHFLSKTNLFKLPLVIHVLKGHISLAGPQVLEDKFALELMNKYTDFHKRFAPKPGLFSPSCYYSYENSHSDYSNELRKDLNYASRQTLKTYLNTL